MIETRRSDAKGYVIILSIFAIALLHFSGLHGNLGLHGIHRELFFIPILLASFWFGFRMGFWVSLLVSAIFVLGIWTDKTQHLQVALAVAQVAVFIFVASLLGWLVDQQRKKNKELLEIERLGILGKTAGVLSWEIRDNVNAIKNICERAGGFRDSQLDNDFRGEMASIESLLEAMTEYASKENLNISTVNLNDTVTEMASRYKNEFNKRGIHLDVVGDNNGCPTKIDPSSISWVIAKLLDNALDASNEGGSVSITTKRHGEHCNITVEDHGVGVSQENLKKLFTPFYSTKEGGSGISLAACKRTMTEIGGDITAESEVGAGTRFRIFVPRKTENC